MQRPARAPLYSGSPPSSTRSKEVGDDTCATAAAQHTAWKLCTTNQVVALRPRESERPGRVLHGAAALECRSIRAEDHRSASCRVGGGEHAAYTAGWCNGHGGGEFLRGTAPQRVRPRRSRTRARLSADRTAAKVLPVGWRTRRTPESRATGQARIPGSFAVDPLCSDNGWDRHRTRCHAQSSIPACAGTAPMRAAPTARTAVVRMFIFFMI